MPNQIFRKLVCQLGWYVGRGLVFCKEKFIIVMFNNYHVYYFTLTITVWKGYCVRNVATARIFELQYLTT